MQLSNATKLVSGIILVTVPTIEFGGAFLLHMLKSSEHGYVDNPLRQNLFRAGHAHAGVLVILSLICQLLVDSLVLSDPVSLGVPCAAILMPLGFFLSVVSPNSQKPNRWIAAVYVGAICLAAGTLVLGIALIHAAWAASLIQ